MAANASTNSFDEAMDDDLFDYDIDIGELDITVPDPVAPPELVTPGKKDNDILGLDKEVSVRKKRVTVKLDEQRLLSINGLPKLRKEAPKKLKFKGKGHEYKDAARLLSYYQLWADDLFKKAKFRDTLQIIEKLGHTRTIREQREEWIREVINEKRDQSYMRDLHRREEGSSKGKEKEKEKAADEDSNDDDLYSLPPPKAPAPADPNALFLGGAPDSDEEMDMDNFNDAELEEVLLEAEKAKASQTADKGKTPALAFPARDEYEFGDDLEATEAMAEFESNDKGKGKSAAPAPVRDEFDDDLEALEAMEAMGDLGGGQPGKAKAAPARDEFADEMEAMEAMGAFD